MSYPPISGAKKGVMFKLNPKQGRAGVEWVGLASGKLVVGDGTEWTRQG